MSTKEWKHDVLRDRMTKTDSDREAVIKAWLPLAILRMSPNKTVEGRKRFQKLVFLAEIEAKIGEPFWFCKHNLGPYSSDLQTALDIFEGQGIIKETKFTIAAGLNPRSDYELTDRGEKTLLQIEEHEFVNLLAEKLESVLSVYMDTDTQDIVKYVYQNYLPTEGSSVVDKVKELRVSIKKQKNLWSRIDDESSISIQVLAGLEQVQDALKSCKKLEELDRYVLMGHSFELTRASKDLFSEIDKYGCEWDAPAQHTLAAMMEFEDTLHALEEFGAKRDILEPLDEQILGDHVDKKERDAIKTEMKEHIKDMI